METDEEAIKTMPTSSMVSGKKTPSSKSKLKPAWGKLLQSSNSPAMKAKKQKTGEKIHKYACMVCMGRKGGKFSTLANKWPSVLDKHTTRHHKDEKDYEASKQILNQDNEKVIEKLRTLSYNPFAWKDSSSASLHSTSSPVPSTSVDNVSVSSLETLAPRKNLPPNPLSDPPPLPSSSHLSPISHPTALPPDPLSKSLTISLPPSLHLLPSLTSPHSSISALSSPLPSCPTPTSPVPGSSHPSPPSTSRLSPSLPIRSSRILFPPSPCIPSEILSPCIPSEILSPSQEHSITQKRRFPSLAGGRTKKVKGMQQNLTSFLDIATDSPNEEEESEAFLKNDKQFHTLYNQNREILEILKKRRDEPSESQIKQPALNPSDKDYCRSLGFCNNFKELENENIIEVLNTEKGLLYVCPTCYKCPNMEHKQSRKFGTLYTGVPTCEERLRELRKGGSQKWRSFKNGLTDHIKSDLHLQAISRHPTAKSTNKALDNIVRAAINTVKTKAAARQFEANVSFISACGGEVGGIGHSR